MLELIRNMHRKTMKIKVKSEHIASVPQTTEEDKAYHNGLNGFIINRLKLIAITQQDQCRKASCVEAVKGKKIKKLIMSRI